MQPPGSFRLHSPTAPPSTHPACTPLTRCAPGALTRHAPWPEDLATGSQRSHVSGAALDGALLSHSELSLLPLPASLPPFIPNHKREKLPTRSQKNVLRQHATKKWRLFFHFQRVSYTKSMVQHVHLDRRWSFFGQ